MPASEVTLIIKAKNAVGRGLKDANRAFSNFAKKARKAIGTAKTALLNLGKAAIGLGASLVGLGAFFVKPAAAAEEMRAKFEVVFGDSAGSVEEWAAKLAEDTNRGKHAIMAMAASMQDLLVPIGIAPEKARNLSKEIVELANDMGSFNDVKTEDVMRDISAALTGSGETMKKYGVVLNITTIKNKALEMGLAATKGEITASDKALAAYNIILNGTKAAHGDAARTAGSLTNIWRGLTAQITESRIEIGTHIVETGELQRAMEYLIPQIKEASAAFSLWVKFGGINQATAGLKTFFAEAERGFATYGTFIAAAAKITYETFIEPVVAGFVGVARQWAEVISAISERRLPDLGKLGTNFIDTWKAIANESPKVWEDAWAKVAEIEQKYTNKIAQIDQDFYAAEQDRIYKQAENRILAEQKKARAAKVADQARIDSAKAAAAAIDAETQKSQDAMLSEYEETRDAGFAINDQMAEDWKKSQGEITDSTKETAKKLKEIFPSFGFENLTGGKARRMANALKVLAAGLKDVQFPNLQLPDFSNFALPKNITGGKVRRVVSAIKALATGLVGVDFPNIKIPDLSKLELPKNLTAAKVRRFNTSIGLLLGPNAPLAQAGNIANIGPLTGLFEALANVGNVGNANITVGFNEEITKSLKGIETNTRGLSKLLRLK